MNKSMIIGGVIGAAVVTAGGVGAVNYYQQANSPQYAEVVNVVAQRKTISEPKQYCENVEITEQVEAKDENRVAGTAIGAILGGVIGNQVGDGRGNKLATLAGAAAGAYAGNKVQQNAQEKNTTTRTEEQCTTRTQSREIITGYQVEYKIGDNLATETLDKKPTAERYQIENGKPLFNQPYEEPAA